MRASGRRGGRQAAPLSFAEVEARVARLERRFQQLEVDLREGRTTPELAMSALLEMGGEHAVLRGISERYGARWGLGSESRNGHGQDG